MIIASHEHYNKDAPDTIWLKLDEDSDLGFWRLYIEGDRGQKPVHAGNNRAAALEKFEEIKAAMLARRDAPPNLPVD